MILSTFFFKDSYAFSLFSYTKFNKFSREKVMRGESQLTRQCQILGLSFFHQIGPQVDVEYGLSPFAMLFVS